MRARADARSTRPYTHLKPELFRAANREGFKVARFAGGIARRVVLRDDDGGGSPEK
jgi:hypothetical protein